MSQHFKKGIALVAVALSGCIKAPCPAGSVCTTGTGGTSGGGSSGAGGSLDATIGAGGSTEGTDAEADAAHAGWTNVTGNLANKASECGNLSLFSAKPDEDVLIAGVSLKGLWVSTDGAATWQSLGGGNSAAITNQPTSIVYDPDHSHQFWESGFNNGGGVYYTQDDGNSFGRLGSVQRVDGVSVDFTDANRKTILAGGHAQAQTLYLSADQGGTWKNVGGTFPQSTDACTRPLVIDTMTYLAGCSSAGGGVSGVLRSADGGGTWTRVASAIGGASAALLASDGKIYWATEGGGLAVSVDQGQSFTALPGPNVANGQSPVELPDGRIAILGVTSILLSADHGATWRAAGPPLPYADAVGVSYSPIRKAFYIWRSDCSDVVPANAIMRYGFDYLKE